MRSQSVSSNPPAAALPRPPRGRLSDRNVPRGSFTDGQLVTLALNGDARAFPLLMARHDLKLRRLIARRVPDAEDAAELRQDTWTCAWAALQSYPAARPFEMWLVCIALNKCRDWGRRRAVRQRAAAYFGDLVPPDAPDPEHEAALADEARLLRDALARLPAALRGPLVLTHAHDLRQREAAAQLGLTPKAIEARLSRARTRMREMLEPAAL